VLDEEGGGTKKKCAPPCFAPFLPSRPADVLNLAS
jgi:hypothetical protein